MPEAMWMTACPACGRHKGAGPLLCLECYVCRKDIVPFAQAGMGFADWLRYALSGDPVLVAKAHLVEQLLEPDDLKDTSPNPT
jgi:hypothetical protein